MRTFDANKTIKAHYVWLEQEVDEEGYPHNLSTLAARRLAKVNECILRGDLTYFEWLLDEVIEYEEDEYRGREKNYVPPVLDEQHRKEALKSLFTEELSYISRLSTVYSSDRVQPSIPLDAKDAKEWFSDTMAALMAILEGKEAVASPNPSTPEPARKKSGRPSADWEAIRGELLRLAERGALPSIKGNRLEIGRMLWKWCVANKKTAGFKEPGKAPTTIKDKDIIKYELDRIESVQYDK